jgi:DNA-binding transcriptional MerR regulator
VIDKAPDAYRTISEVAEELDLPQHVLRFWETRFAQIKPLKRGGGRRYYRPDDVELLKGIRHLLYSEGYTIKGVQRILKDQGPKAVQALMKPAGDGAEGAAPPLPVAEAHRPVAPPPAPVPVQHRPAPPPVEVAPPVAPHVPPPAPRAEPYLPPVAPPAPPPLPEPVYTRAPHASPFQSEGDLFSVDDEAASLPLPQVVVPPPSPANVSFMRGGLNRPVLPAAPVEIPAPQPSQTFSVRRTIRPAPPAGEDTTPPRYSPLVEPELGVSPPAAPARPPGMSEDSRRALQSALFELTECRRVIDRVIAARAR